MYCFIKRKLNKNNWLISKYPILKGLNATLLQNLHQLLQNLHQLLLVVQLYFFRLKKLKLKKTAVEKKLGDLFFHVQQFILYISDSGQVVSMLREPKLETFYSPPKFDLKLNYDQEKKPEEDEEEVQPWPNIDQLFGGDPEYQNVTSDIMDYINGSLEDVMDYTTVSFKNGYSLQEMHTQKTFFKYDLILHFGPGLYYFTKKSENV